VDELLGLSWNEFICGLWAGGPSAAEKFHSSEANASLPFHSLCLPSIKGQLAKKRENSPIKQIN